MNARGSYGSQSSSAISVGAPYPPEDLRRTAIALAQRSPADLVGVALLYDPNVVSRAAGMAPQWIVVNFTKGEELGNWYAQMAYSNPVHWPYIAIFDKLEWSRDRPAAESWRP